MCQPLKTDKGVKLVTKKLTKVIAMQGPNSNKNTDLIEKYNRNGPRYTSYPTAMELAKGIKDADLFDAVQGSHYNELSLYIHIPFCHQLCYYCACNKMVTRQAEKVSRYLIYLCNEIIQRSVHFTNKPVCQIHLGGGTPNYLRPSQLKVLIDTLHRHYQVKADAEISIELDPRLVQQGDLAALRNMGFNRISMGIQDFDSTVQQAINRVQTLEEVQRIMDDARQLGFESVNMDLIYGLPHQSLATTELTLACIEQLQPDRVSLFNYAHMPDRFAAQRKIKEAWLPSSSTKTAMQETAKARLLQLDYQHIGMDHFAKTHDSLSLAKREGRLHRNFQGYTELNDADLLGFGITSISQIGNVIAQNCKTLHDYYQQIDQHHARQEASVVERGIRLSQDDLIRAAVIKQLICHCHLDITAIETAFGIDFMQYFSEELALLAPMVEDNLLQIHNKAIHVAEQGRQFSRTICMTFDKYLPKYQRNLTFSKVI